MAIYHLTAKTVSRGGNSSAKARSEYIDRAGRYRNDAGEVLYKESGNMPDWAESAPVRYWEAADQNERANGRLFKQLEFALPIELSTDQQRELAASFCRKTAQTKDGLLPYSFSIHKGRDQKNPHCHLMLSERLNDGYSRTPETWFKRANKNREKGGAAKTEELKPKEWLHNTRESWAARTNQALELGGHASRLDHRSLRAQGIEREATVHLGPAAAAMERKGMKTERGSELQTQKIALRAIRELESKIDDMNQENAKNTSLDGVFVENSGIRGTAANAFGLTMEKLNALADEHLKNISRSTQQKTAQPVGHKQQRGLER